jgi:hypothetical protein
MNGEQIRILKVAEVACLKIQIYYYTNTVLGKIGNNLEILESGCHSPAQLRTSRPVSRIEVSDVTTTLTCSVPNHSSDAPWSFHIDLAHLHNKTSISNVQNPVTWHAMAMKCTEDISFIPEALVSFSPPARRAWLWGYQEIALQYRPRCKLRKGQEPNSWTLHRPELH